MIRKSELTLAAQWNIHVVNRAISAKDLAQMLLGHVLCQALDHDLDSS